MSQLADNRAPTCSDFGENRIGIWPGFFFCHPCEMYDDAIRLGNKRCKRSQKKYRCTAGHDNFDSPSTKINKWCRDVIEKTNANDNSTTSATTINMEQSVKKSSNFTIHYNKLKTNNYTLIRNNYRLKEILKDNDEDEGAPTLTWKINNSLEDIMNAPPCA